MAQIATEFFSNILGNRNEELPNLREEAMQRVLQVQEDRLTPLEKEQLNGPLTLAELGEATLELSNDKCPGPDGTPVEFFKAHWLTGPTMHLPRD